MSRKQSFSPLSAEEAEFFQNFYEEYKGFLFYITKRYTPKENDCEDIVQDSIIRLLYNTKALMELDHPKRVKYIALTVKSAFLDHERKLLAAKEVDLDDDKLTLLLAQSSFHNDDVSERTKLDVYQLKEALSQRDWLVLEGKYILGYSQEELSAIAGVSADSIRMILHRARKKARNILLTETGNGGDEHG